MVEAATNTEQQSPISKEKEILVKEENFFASHKPANYVGILTNHDISTVSRLYPEIIDGMLLYYSFAEKDEMDPLSEEWFLARHFRNLYATGTLLTNVQIEEIRNNMSNGVYVLRVFFDLAGKERNDLRVLIQLCLTSCLFQLIFLYNRLFP